MKQFLISILFVTLSLACHAQSYQLNVTLSADSWGLMSALYKSSGDSVGARFERKLRAAVQVNLPISTWSQTITVDTVPNVIINWMYATYKDLPNGLTALYDGAGSIPAIIEAMTHPDIVAHRTVINSRYSARRTDEIRPEATRKNINY